MLIVFDASTLILLAKTELLDEFLDSFAGEVLIPAEVERECCGARKSLDALIIERAINEKRIVVKVLKERQLCRKIRADFTLGSGEVAAIALALSAKAQLVGVDDKSGINACKLLKLPFATAINILIRMRERGLIGKDEAFIKLAQLEQYGRYESSIIADARSRLEGANDEDDEHKDG